MPHTPGPHAQAPLVDPARLRRAKRSYTTRHVDLDRAHRLVAQAAPESGDLVLARVVDLGQHAKLELSDGRRATLFPGDEVVVAYGRRYAPDQFHADLPPDLAPCELVAAGGLAGAVQAAHAKMRPATTLVPAGLLVDQFGDRLNLRGRRRLGPVRAPARGPRPVTVAVVGAAMNAGKTTSAAHLVRGLARAGLRVGAAKVTGTGAGGDLWLLQDAGAWPVYDFTSAGVPSTYGVSGAELLGVFGELTGRLHEDGCEVVVLEVADGVYQDETAELVTSPVFAAAVDALLFAASDALGARAGVSWLQDRGLPPLALTGVLSASPLASQEAERATGAHVWGLERLEDPTLARQLVEALRRERPAAAGGLVDPGPVLEAVLSGQGYADSDLARSVSDLVDAADAADARLRVRA